MTVEGDIHDPAYVAGVFDRCASNYRFWSNFTSFGFIPRWRRQCVDALPEGGPPDPKVLDLMAGTGEIWPVLLSRRGYRQITTVDISHQMHVHALERLHRDRADSITHIEADVLTSDLPDACADCVVSTFGLKTMSPAQLDTLAAQIARILKPGGAFSLIEASDPHGWWLRPLYRFYMDRVLPLVERYAMKGAQDFSMIGVYTRSFRDCSYFADALRRQGMEVRMERYFFGCATGVAGHRPEEAKR